MDRFRDSSDFLRMRRFVPVFLVACSHPPAALVKAPPPPKPKPKPTIPSDRIDAFLFGKPFVPRSAVAIGMMEDENGVEDKTIVLSDAPFTCDQAKAAWGSDRTDTSITMSAIAWQAGKTTTFTDESGSWVATFDGTNPDIEARDQRIAIGTVTTLRAATAVGETGRVRVDLRVADSDDHARGEIDVLQCE